jgi:AcrR family transcriptional regulator
MAEFEKHYNKSDGDCWLEGRIGPSMEEHATTTMPGRKRKPSSPHALQLPSGRHGLDRDFVVAQQRERIMSAFAETVAGFGFAGASVERVAARAGVSRRTFYEQFANKEDAYLQLYGALTGELVERMTTAGADGEGDWPRRCLATLLAYVAGEPMLARLCVVDMLGAGPPALAERDRVLRTFAALLERLATAGGEPPLAPLAAEGLVGAIYDVIYNRIAQDQTCELPDLLDDLHSFCLSVLSAPRLSPAP